MPTPSNTVGFVSAAKIDEVLRLGRHPAGNLEVSILIEQVDYPFAVVHHLWITMMRAIEIANPDVLDGIFGDAPWTNRDRLPDATLKNLIEHFSTQTLSVANVPEDELGNAYEYLIKKFADLTNKKAGEFYTPRSVVRLMVNILDPKTGETVYDPEIGRAHV